jgi:hypothetical protein
MSETDADAHRNPERPKEERRHPPFGDSIDHAQAAKTVAVRVATPITAQLGRPSASKTATAAPNTIDALLVQAR